VRPSGGGISWLIRAMRLIRCTIDPLIHHEARINHVNGGYYRTGERIEAGVGASVTKVPYEAALANRKAPIEPEALLTHGAIDALAQ
jgi:hypothetical protein